MVLIKIIQARFLVARKLFVYLLTMHAYCFLRLIYTITGYQDVTAYSETALENAAANQPVSVAIAASGLAFQLYSGGIFTGPCSTKLDHGVTVVGYDNTGRTRYWMVKNLRGASWGSLVT